MSKEILGDAETGELISVETGTEEVLIDEVNFPDDNFRAYVEEAFDTDGNGKLSEEEISNVEWIEVDGAYDADDDTGVWVSSLKGIEYFSNLTSLSCEDNNLSSLDVSRNVALQRLECGGNNLSSLDVSQNINLTMLACNRNNLSSLDVSRNVNLVHLYCDNNNLASLDVSRNINLTELVCYYNNLVNLDVSQNANLISLSCSGNNLANLDVSWNVDLESLRCSGNNLSSLDVSRNVYLMELYCGNNNLARLDVSQNEDLIYLSCSDNNLPYLDVSRNIYCDCSPQEISGKAYQEDGVWKLDLAALVGKNNMDKVTIITAGIVKSGDYAVFSEDAIYNILLNGRVLEYKYLVNPASGHEMNIHVSLSAEGEVEHTHTFKTLTDQQATCGTAGKQHRECSICGYKEAATTIPATGKHSYGSYVVTKQATALEPGAKTRTCSVCKKTENVTIAKLAPTATLTMTSIPMKAKQSTTTFKVSGLAAGDKVISYKSSNTKVATINAKGKITAKKKGTATITVTLASGKTVTAKVKVQTSNVKTKKVTLNSKKVSLKKGKSYTLKATLSPLTSQQKVTYASSNKKVATVNSKGKIVAKKKGTATITVKSGSKKATCKVTVK